VVVAVPAERVRSAVAAAGRRLDGWLVGLLAAAGVWSVVFSRLVLQRHARFRTIDFDLGIHDQSIWLLSRFTDFCTVRGLPVFGHHASFGYFAFVPFYWLGAGPNFLNVVQVLALAGGVVPIYLLARHRELPALAGLLLGLAWLAQPPLQWFLWETFHPEVIAIPLLLWAYLCAERGQTRWYWILVIAALAQKEDIAFAVAMIGLIWLVRRRVRLGATTVGVAALWFVVFGMWMVPAAAGGGTVYGLLYGELGDTPGEVAKTAITDPSEIWHRLDQNGAGDYTNDILTPTGLAPLAAPEVLAIGAPQAVLNLLTTANFTWDLRYHYQAMPMVGIGLGLVEGVARIARLNRRPDGRAMLGTGLAGLVLVFGLWGTRSSGPSPWGEQYRAGVWPLLPTLDKEVREQALRLIGSSDGVSADFFMTPHLTHRRVVYTFPNPWFNKNYGISFETKADPAEVDWIVLDLSLVTIPTERLMYDQLIATGEFEVRLQAGTVVVAQRMHPPPP